MKKLNLLIKDEMREVLGCVMDKETTLQYCLDHIMLDGENSVENTLILSVGTDVCWQGYYGMES